VYSIAEAKENIKEIKLSFIFLDSHLADGNGSDFIPMIKDISRIQIIMIQL
jgi:response regulator of citrate/malate metabolism